MTMFDQIWGYFVIGVPLVISLVTLIVQATPSQRDDEIWGKISGIIGRIFSVKKEIDPQTGKSDWKLPVVQSVKANSVLEEKKK